MLVRLVIDGAVRRAGYGALEVSLVVGDLRVAGGSLVWLVTTNKGWAHVRGVAVDAGTGEARPFRADLCSAAAAGHDGPDRLALRFYAARANPNVDGPTHKVQGGLPRGSVRLGTQAG